MSLPEPLVQLLWQFRRIQTEQRKGLRRPLKDDDLIFTRADGTAFGPAVASHAFRRVQDEAGLKDSRLHYPRYPYAALLLKTGKHPLIVSAQLGHGGTRTTVDTYSHLLPGLQEEAVKSLRAFLPKRLPEGNV